MAELSISALSIAALERTITYLTPKDRWCKGRPEDGEKRCIWSSLHEQCADPEVFRVAYGVLERLVPGTLTKFNDTHTHAEVLALLKRGVEAAKGNA